MVQTTWVNLNDFTSSHSNEGIFWLLIRFQYFVAKKSQGSSVYCCIFNSGLSMDFCFLTSGLLLFWCSLLLPASCEGLGYFPCLPGCTCRSHIATFSRLTGFSLVIHLRSPAIAWQGLKFSSTHSISMRHIWEDAVGNSLLWGAICQ